MKKLILISIAIIILTGCSPIEVMPTQPEPVFTSTETFFSPATEIITPSPTATITITEKPIQSLEEIMANIAIDPDRGTMYGVFQGFFSDEYADFESLSSVGQRSEDFLISDRWQRVGLGMETETINLITQIGNWITTILVFFTLLEMIKQRKATYKPDIVVGRKSIYAYYSNNGLPDIWLDQTLDEFDQNKINKHHRGFYLPVYNLGLGAARNIEFTWSYDREDILDRIEVLSGNSSSENYIGTTDYGFLEISLAGKLHISINLKNDISQELEFLLPFLEGDNQSKIPIPFSYILLVSYLIDLQISNYKEGNTETPIFTLPELELFIRYRDIGESIHSKKIKFLFSVSSYYYSEYSVGSLVFLAYVEN